MCNIYDNDFHLNHLVYIISMVIYKVTVNVKKLHISFDLEGKYMVNKPVRNKMLCSIGKSNEQLVMSLSSFISEA